MREKKEIHMQIGERVKQARERTGLTQERLAEQIEVSPQYISDLERGVVGVSVATLKRLCVALRVSGDGLLFGTVSDFSFLPILDKCSSLPQAQRILLYEIIEKYIAAVTLPKEH